jgi:hypothetical protein
MKICIEQIPEELEISPGHKAACWMNVKKEAEENALLPGANR